MIGAASPETTRNIFIALFHDRRHGHGNFEKKSTCGDPRTLRPDDGIMQTIQGWLKAGSEAMRQISQSHFEEKRCFCELRFTSD
jgi:hypothetical protein